MSFINFTGKRAAVAKNRTFQKLLDDLVMIRDHYPELYKILAIGPQYDYDLLQYDLCETCLANYHNAVMNMVQGYVTSKLTANRVLAKRDVSPTLKTFQTAEHHISVN
ncbi:MAG: hypothetical protein V7724_06985 [Sediminicola sp.]